MEFNEKLQELRKKKGLTQVELANVLYVSRTAVSKWESGRGYPNIESLKRIGEYFSVSIDELLSCDAILTIAQEESRGREQRLRSFIFGLLDCSAVLLLFLPLFAKRSAGIVRETSLLLLTDVEPYIKAILLAAVISMILCGAADLILQSCRFSIWLKSKDKISLGLNIMCTLIFIAAMQIYMAGIVFLILLIKALLVK